MSNKSKKLLKQLQSIEQAIGHRQEELLALQTKARQLTDELVKVIDGGDDSVDPNNLVLW